MAMVRVFESPDGSVRVMHLNERHRRPGETDAEFFNRETTKQPDLLGLPFADVDASQLPTDRSKRYAWRRQGGRVMIDPAIPTPPNPRQNLLDKIDQATTMDELKEAMKDVVGS